MRRHYNDVTSWTINNKYAKIQQLPKRLTAHPTTGSSLPPKQLQLPITTGELNKYSTAMNPSYNGELVSNGTQFQQQESSTINQQQRVANYMPPVTS